MPALFLTEENVRELIDMQTSIEVVERAFLHLADETATNVLRSRAAAPGIFLHTMSAAAEYLGYVGWKCYTTTRAGARFHVAIYHAETGEMAALMEADHLGRLRTGAASGVATQYLSRDDAALVGLFGTGRQARTQLEAVRHVRNIERVDVYSRDQQRRERFAEKMGRSLGVPVVAVSSPEQAVVAKDIVITATSSREPVFEGRWIEEGAHINAVGSNFLQKAELDADAVGRADRIVCDSIEQCKIEAGDFAEAINAGQIAWEQMHDLAEVVAGRAPGRQSADEVTLFKSVGLAIEDVALAAELLKRARTQRIGKELPF